MENSLLVIFGENWPKSLYYSTGILSDFGATLKNRKKSKFNRNELKLSTQLKTCICIRKKYKNGEFSTCHFW